MDPVTQNVVARYKQGASEIELSELPAEQMAFVKKLERRFGRATTAWDGIHGIIVEFEPKGMQVQRLNKDDLKSLLSDSNFRWVQAERDGISVGM